MNLSEYRRNNDESTNMENRHLRSAPDLLFINQFENETLDKSEIRNHSKVLPKSEDCHAWVILCAVVCFYTVVGYHQMAFGLYYVIFVDVFDSTKAATGFIGSIYVAVFASFSIFASVFIDLYGTRRVGIVGSLLAFIGIFSSAFAVNIYMLYITYGLLTGLGGSMNSLCAQVTIQQHFDKHRKLATSLSMIGIPIGSLVSPFITNLLFDIYGWRGTLMIQSGIYLNSLAMMITFSEVKNTKTPKNRQHMSMKFFKRLFDCTVWKNFTFIPFTIYTICLTFNIFAFIDHTPSRAVFFGASLKEAGFLVTIMYFSALIGRSLCSILSAIGWLKELSGNLIVVLVQGSCSFSLPLCSNYSQVMVVTSLFGFAQGFQAPCILLVTVKLFGVDYFGRAKAINGLMASMASFTATPLTGWLFDVTQNYNIPFYFSGSVSTGAVLSMIILIIIYNVRKRKDKKILQQEMTINIQDNELYFNDLDNKRCRTSTM